MTPLSTEEVSKIFVDFIDDRDLLYDFKHWLDTRGYTLADLGFKEEE